MLGPESGAEFVQDVFPAMSHLSMHRLDAIFLVCLLCNSEPLLPTAIDALRFKLFTRGQRSEVFQDPDPSRPRLFPLIWVSQLPHTLAYHGPRAS